MLHFGYHVICSNLYYSCLYSKSCEFPLFISCHVICFSLYYILGNCIILYCLSLFSNILDCVLYCVLLVCITSHYVSSIFIMHYIILCCFILHYIMLFCLMLKITLNILIFPILYIRTHLHTHTHIDICVCARCSKVGMYLHVFILH